MNTRKMFLVLTFVGIGCGKAAQTNLYSGPVVSEQAAVDRARPLLECVYGTEYVKRFEPYRAYKQHTSEIWHVSGTLRTRGLGGTPAAEIFALDGSIVSVFHEE